MQPHPWINPTMSLLLQSAYVKGDTECCGTSWSSTGAESTSVPGNLCGWFDLDYAPTLLVQFSLFQLLSRVRLFATPWIAAHQAFLSITNSRSSLRLMSIESVMPSSHLILCRPLFLLPPIPPSIRVFSNESTLCMRWPKYWSFTLTSVLPIILNVYLFFRLPIL